jgi:hypothetical protein
MLEKLACLLACWLVFRVRAIFPVESSSRDWRQQKQNTPFSNNDYSSVSGDFLCFKVPIERVTLTEYNDVNFIEFPDL